MLRFTSTTISFCGEHPPWKTWVLRWLQKIVFEGMIWATTVYASRVFFSEKHQESHVDHYNRGSNDDGRNENRCDKTFEESEFASTPILLALVQAVRDWRKDSKTWGERQTFVAFRYKLFIDLFSFSLTCSSVSKKLSATIYFYKCTRYITITEDETKHSDVVFEIRMWVEKFVFHGLMYA